MLSIRYIFRPTLAALLVASSCPAQASDKAWWRFEGLNEMGAVPDEVGDAHLKPRNDPNFEPGLYGNAVRFDQGRPNFSTATQGSVSLENDFTIRCVVKPDWVKTYNVVVWKGDRSKAPEAINYYLGIRDGRVEFKYKDNENRWFIHTAPTRIEAGEWYEIAVYFEGGKVEMVINGSLQQMNAPEGGGTLKALLPNDAPMEVGEGAKPTVRAFEFNGLIDELRFSSGRHLAYGPEVYTAFLERLKSYRERFAAYEAEQKAKAEQVRNQQEKAYAEFFRVLKEAPFVVRVLPSTLRINKHPGFLDELRSLGDELTLSGARNEYEAGQLIVAAHPERTLHGVSVEMSDLKSVEGGVIPAEHGSWGWVKTVRTESSGVPVDFLGEIPDVVMEGLGPFEVKAGDFTPVLIRWYVPNGTPAGRYQGTVTVRNDDGEKQIPVRLRVFDFDLPKRNSIPVAFTFFEKYYADWYGVDRLSDEQKLGIYEFLFKYRVPPNNIYSSDIYPELHLLEKLKDRMNFITLGGWREVYSPQKAEEKVARYKTYLEQLEAMGLKDYAYFYGVDELHYHVKERLPIAQQSHRYLQRNFPELGRMQTSFPKDAYERLYNVWVPYISYFSRPEWNDKLQELKANGDELWWYVADGPVKPYPNFFLDYPPFDSRIFMMMSYHYQVAGVLYWAVNREWVTNNEIRKEWPNAEWKPYIYHISEGTKKERNGMGNYVYPGPDGRILPSLRFENLRDGIEDYEYMMVLKGEVKRAATKKGADADLVISAKSLLEVPKEVLVAVDDYNADPSALEKYRVEVAEMIERLRKE